MDVISILRYSYLSAALAVLLVAVTPPLRNRFLAYGARTSQRPLTSAEKEKKRLQAKQKQEKKESGNVASAILDEVQSWQVPHDWFWTFYFISVVLSTFWPGEGLYLKGPLYEAVAQNTRSMKTSMTFEQVKITWILMLVQGGRRMYESLTLVQPEDEDGNQKDYSTMWTGHWVLGMLFYTLTSVAIWVEGIPALEAHELSFRDLVFHAPSFRTIISVLIFILASGFQNDCHSYLAYLKNKTTSDQDGKKSNATKDAGEYKLPTHPAFHALISPHYTAECMIYLSLALVSAPQGAWINLTMSCALVFVVVNLGVTADVTREWYKTKFGEDAVRGKWRMIPPIY